MTTIDALRQVQETLEFIVDCNGIAVLDPIGSKELLANVRLAIKQMEQREPAAYLYEFFADRGHLGLAFEPQRSADNTPLYTAPHQPLTDDLCERICKAIKAEDDKLIDEAAYMLDSDDCIRIVREQFAAHGIVGGQK